MASKTVTQNPQAPQSGRNPLIDGLTCPMVEFYRAQGYNPDESVAYLMRRIISVASQQIERELEPTGLTNAQWVPLLKLYMGTASTVAELARSCELDAGSMTRLLDRLEAKQLCRRVRSSDDRRVVNLELTEAGRVAAKGIPDILCRVQNAHLSGFSAEEWQVLKGFLRRILDTAQGMQSASDKASGKSPASLITPAPSQADHEQQA
ncbi:MAG: MarR family transcriptional regulator [Pseudomonadota bacterium]